MSEHEPETPESAPAGAPPTIAKAELIGEGPTDTEQGAPLPAEPAASGTTPLPTESPAPGAKRAPVQTALPARPEGELGAPWASGPAPATPSELPGAALSVAT